MEKFTLLKEDANVEPAVWRLKDLVDAKDATMEATMMQQLMSQKMLTQEQVGKYHSTKLKMGLC